MKKNVLLFVLASMLTAMQLHAQGDSAITRITFTSLTRGYQKQIVITPDSSTLLISKQETRTETRKLEKGEWKNLLTCVKKIKPEVLPELKSPTMKRAHDGALHSTITIISEGKEWSHSFDDEDPHEKLRPLLKIVKRIGERPAK
jgi:hypothetical protein